MMINTIDFIEESARINAEFHLGNADSLLREGNTFLNLVLAGGGGSLALMLSLAEKSAPLWQTAGTGAASAYLFFISGVLVFKCLWARPIYPPANEPKNLMQEGFEIEQIRRTELKNRQACIDANRDRNDSVGMWLNRCRGMAAITPIMFAMVAYAVY